MIKRLTTQDFINRAKIVHKDKYDYKNIKYEKGIDKVLIVCPIHGEFLQIAANHLQGQGCPSCGLIHQKTAQLSNLVLFIQKANVIHKSFYCYDKAFYLGSKKKVTITCPIHGNFEQTPNDHLRKRGCKQCHLTSGVGYSKSDFIRISSGKECTFYILKCWNENEEFYKIGITSTTIIKRYYGKNKMPYNYEILKEIKGTASEVWDLEVVHKKLFKDFKYKTEIKFKGSSTECFTKII